MKVPIEIANLISHVTLLISGNKSIATSSPDGDLALLIKTDKKQIIRLFFSFFPVLLKIL